MVPHRRGGFGHASPGCRAIWGLPGIDSWGLGGVSRGPPQGPGGTLVLLNLFPAAYLILSLRGQRPGTLGIAEVVERVHGAARVACGPGPRYT